MESSRIIDLRLNLPGKTTKSLVDLCLCCGISIHVLRTLAGVPVPEDGVNLNTCHLKQITFRRIRNLGIQTYPIMNY